LSVFSKLFVGKYWRRFGHFYSIFSLFKKILLQDGDNILLVFNDLPGNKKIFEISK